jgi:hypothetical protein
VKPDSWGAIQCTYPLIRAAILELKLLPVENGEPVSPPLTAQNAKRAVPAASSRRNRKKYVSADLVAAVQEAKKIRHSILGIVGRGRDSAK